MLNPQIKMARLSISTSIPILINTAIITATATFIGYQLNGIPGAIAATLGIFLPSFLFVLILNPWIPKMRQSRVLSHFLDAVNVAAVAVMIAVLIRMGMEVLIDWRAILILGLSIYVTFFQKQISSMWVILGGAVLGWLLALV